MKNWLSDFYKDMRFLMRKTRRTFKVLMNPKVVTQMIPGNGIATANGRRARRSEPQTTDALLTGEPSHYIGQNRNRINARSAAMRQGNG